MNPRIVFDFVLLAALWGSSFLFMRIASPEFGAFALSGLRVFIAGLLLLVIVIGMRRTTDLVRHWKPIAVMGVLNSALPFLFFAYALAHITSGLGAILNATVPLWGAVVAFVWLKDKMSAIRVLGLVLGFMGVTWLVWGKVSFQPGSGLAVIACLAATLFYGITASFSKRYLTGVDPICSAAGSQLSAACVLIPLALMFWPDHEISNKAWLSACVLAVFCTALAYILYFRLLREIGPSKTITVTFLIPVFGMAWGALFLDETVSLQMIVASGVVLLGTSVTMGIIGVSKKPKG
jgi:drug/metabolite transporter (DMT)-like permease